MALYFPEMTHGRRHKLNALDYIDWDEYLAKKISIGISLIAIRRFCRALGIFNWNPL